jgi:hypothetical protein
MKLFVLGIIAAIAVPLSSFGWEAKASIPVKEYVEVVHEPIRDEPTNTPTPTVEPEPIAVPEIAQVEAISAVQPVPVPEPVAETTVQYLNRLANAQGITVPIRYGTCIANGIDPSTINGCYIPYSHYITITDKGLAYGEEWAKCIIRHEYRHYFQDVNGMYQYLNGYISNHNLLEADAQNYAGC